MNGDSLLPVVNGRRIPAAELSIAFDKVKDSERWKNPIAKIIDNPTKEEEQIIGEAIIFYTGSVATFTPIGFGAMQRKTRVEAAGYYMTIGA